MAVPSELIAALLKIDIATNNLSEVVKGLRAKISTNMTAEDVTAVKDKLGEVSAGLDGIAADPAAVVPPGPPVAPI